MSDAKLIERLRDACRGGDECKCSLSEAADLITALLAQNAALRAARDETYAYAKRLAEAIFAKGEFDAPQWRPLDDTLGVLTQIDNMVAGIRVRAEAAEAEVEKLRGALEKIAGRPDYRLPKPQDIARAALTTEERK